MRQLDANYVEYVHDGSRHLRLAQRSDTATGKARNILFEGTAGVVHDDSIVHSSIEARRLRGRVLVKEVDVPSRRLFLYQMQQREFSIAYDLDVALLPAGSAPEQYLLFDFDRLTISTALGVVLI